MESRAKWTHTGCASTSEGGVVPIIEDRLIPCDGLNNYNVFLSRMEMELHGSAQFTFSVTHSMLPVGEFSVSVPAAGQSMDRMAVDAHDALIDILRQLMFRAEKARTAHQRHAARHAASAELETMIAERRPKPEVDFQSMDLDDEI